MALAKLPSNLMGHGGGLLAAAVADLRRMARAGITDRTAQRQGQAVGGGKWFAHGFDNAYETRHGKRSGIKGPQFGGDGHEFLASTKRGSIGVTPFLAGHTLIYLKWWQWQ